MEIKVKIISQFGNQRIFPACDQAQLFCDIAHVKSLTTEQIAKIKLLGFSVNVVQNIQTI